MAKPANSHRVNFAEEKFVIHQEEKIVFVNGNYCSFIDGKTLVHNQEYQSHAYARTDAERIAQKLFVKNNSPTEVRREMEGSESYGRVPDDTGNGK